mmetsp:Transcript_116387/g.336180  ORF Transcript_116387/g.336180 Transcript_116387/m.336180 type:complete len:216 (+) Transcript_116387:166-813(+)
MPCPPPKNLVRIRMLSASAASEQAAAHRRPPGRPCGSSTVAGSTVCGSSAVASATTWLPQAGLLEEARDLLAALLILDDIRGLCNGLDARFVDLGGDAEEPLLTPLRAPTILDAPILFASLLAPTDEQHGVVDALPLPVAGMDERFGRGGRLVDARGVEHEVLGGLEAEDERPAAVQLLLDGLHAGVPVPRPDVAVPVSSETLAPHGLQVALQLA